MNMHVQAYTTNRKQYPNYFCRGHGSQLAVVTALNLQWSRLSTGCSIDRTTMVRSSTAVKSLALAQTLAEINERPRRWSHSVCSTQNICNEPDELATGQLTPPATGATDYRPSAHHDSTDPRSHALLPRTHNNESAGNRN